MIPAINTEVSCVTQKVAPYGQLKEVHRVSAPNDIADDSRLKIWVVD